jgi:predicted ATPase/DNA-binding SARP family transcriptional activator
MEFGVLGPLAVSGARGKKVAVHGKRRCELLAILLLHANEHVSAARLAEELWPNGKPKSAHNALQVHISYLRKVLGEQTAIATGAAGYSLRVDLDRIDARRFERLLVEGRKQLVTRAHEAACQTLRDALSLWRGPALADFRDAPFAQADIVRLEELRLAALEDRIDADLALGRHAELVAELESVVAAHPLRERLRGQLMLAFYRAGRQADALGEFRRARRVLIGELGIEPSIALKALQAAILRQDPSLDREGGDGLAWTLTRAERRTVTTLCAAFTRPRGGDPELSEEARARPIEEAVGIFERFGGRVLETGADRVLAVFGLPRANEDDSLRALRSAVELRAAVDAAENVAVGIGVDTGSVLARPSAPNRPGVVGDLLADVAGAAYAAGPGEILVGETTRLLAGHALRLGSARRRRGRNRVWRLLGMSSDAPPFPRREATPFVGREQELDQLLHVFERTVVENTPSLITIFGSAGIGKSRLAAELRLRVAAEASVYVGRCLPYGEGITFWPLAEIVEQAAGERAPGALAERLAGDAEAATIAERIAVALGAGDGGTAGAEETFWAVRRFLEGIARTRPVVVFLEDLHWAEPTFLDLVDHVADLARSAPLLLICLARPELLERRPTWGGGKANATSMSLEPLSDDESAALIERVAPEAPVASANRARIVEAAGGNPLFIEELVRMTVEGGEAAEQLALPPTIQAVLAARLDQLRPGERAVLEAASVVGKEFWLAAVLELADENARDGLNEHLRRLIRKDLVRPDSPAIGGEEAFRFGHLLIRDVAYDAIPKSRRADLHQQFGEWLARTSGDRLPELEEIVGFHLDQAFQYRVELGSVDGAARELAARAARHMAAAALRAHAREDIPAEIALLSRAVELLPAHDRRRLALLPDLGEALREAGDFSRAKPILDEAERLASAAADRGLAAYARVIRLRLEMQTDPDFSVDEVEGAARDAVADLEARGDDRRLAKGWELRALLPYLRCDAQEAEDALQRVVEHSRRAGDLRQEGRALSLLLGTAVFGPLRVGDGISRCNDILERHAASPRITASATRALASLKSMRGDFDEARALVAHDKALSEELGLPLVAARACFAYGSLELLADDPVAAETELRAGYDVLAEVGDKSALCNVAAVLAQALYLQGEDDESLRFAAEAQRAAAGSDRWAQVYWRGAQAKLLARQGSLDEAEELAGEAIAFAFDTDSLNTRGDALMDAAEVFRLADRPEEAAARMRKAIHAYDRKGNRVAARKARRALAELVEPVLV